MGRAHGPRSARRGRGAPASAPAGFPACRCAKPQKRPRIAPCDLTMLRVRAAAIIGTAAPARKQRSVTRGRRGARPRNKMLVLGIETTCDETAAAIVRRHEDGRGEILSNVILSQSAEHAAY